MESFGVTSLGVVYELNQEQGGVLLDSGTGNPGSFEQIARAIPVPSPCHPVGRPTLSAWTVCSATTRGPLGATAARSPILAWCRSPSRLTARAL